jgi:hypothetical protein
MTQVRPDIVKRLATMEILLAPAPESVKVILENYPGESESHARSRAGHERSTPVMVVRVVDARKGA